MNLICIHLSYKINRTYLVFLNLIIHGLFSLLIYLKFSGWQNKYISTVRVSTGSPDHTDKRHFLTFIPQGRLGNQMFQYASVLGIAAKNDRTPFVHPEGGEGGCLVCKAFNLTYTQRQPNSSVVKQWRHFRERGWGKYDSRFEALPEDDLVIGMYLQSFKYFNDTYYIDIKKEFKFIKSIDTLAHTLMSSALIANVSASVRNIMDEYDVITVGIHVRRGDLTDDESKIKFGYLVPSSAYFTKAMTYMRARHEHVVFLVTSNNYTWSRQNVIGEDVVFVAPASPEVHMATLSKGNHVIMSVGTFGWWAGFLSGGDVIYYNTPYKVGSSVAEGYSRGDFYPEHWIGIGE